MMLALRAQVAGFVLTNAPTAPASRAWNLEEVVGVRASRTAAVAVVAGLRPGAGPGRRNRERRCSSRGPSTRWATRWRACRYLRLPGSFQEWPRAPFPDFAISIPKSSPNAAYILRAWRDVARRFAFVEYDGPPLEPLELYTKKSGDEIVGAVIQLHRQGRARGGAAAGDDADVRAHGGRQGQRPAQTRALVLVPQLFRYERQQKGRLREHFQLNVDIVGEPDVTADAELLARGHRDHARTAASRRTTCGRACPTGGCCSALLAALGVSEDQTPAVFAVLDKIERQPLEVSREKLAGLGLAEGPVERVVGLSGARIDRRSAIASTAATRRWRSGSPRCDRYLGYLARAWAWPIGWISTSRSCAGWRTTPASSSSCSTRTGELRAICGGGRYDTCSSRWAAWTCRRSASAWATWCLANCSAPGASCEPRSTAPDYLGGVRRAGAACRGDASGRRCSRRGGASVEYALRAAAAWAAAQGGRGGWSTGGRDRARRPHADPQVPSPRVKSEPLDSTEGRLV